ncbi:MAG: metallophosphoesterase [Lachnospiraceae bacterium]|nr:metallophosphoesterase [Lachnospiraceae bacterium]
MKKVLIISDNHGKSDLMNELIRTVRPIDLLVHCGDAGLYEMETVLAKKADCPVYIVAGNNDYGSGYPLMTTFELCGKKVLLTHGHKHQVYYDLMPLYYLAKENQADIVMFGHLHIPVHEEKDGITLVNPGSLTYPRQFNRLPSYMMLTVDDNGKFHYAVRYIERSGRGIVIV